MHLQLSSRSLSLESAAVEDQDSKTFAVFQALKTARSKSSTHSHCQNLAECTVGLRVTYQFVADSRAALMGKTAAQTQHALVQLLRPHVSVPKKGISKIIPQTAAHVSVQMCVSCWCTLFSVSKSTFYKYFGLAADSASGTATNRTRNAKPDRLRARAIDWLNNYVNISGNVELMPHNKEKHLPQGYTYRMLYVQFRGEEQHAQELMVAPPGVCGDSFFQKIRREGFPELKTRDDNQFSRCDKCAQYDDMTAKAGDEYQVRILCIATDLLRIV
jgi:hypothetical protein